LGELRPLSILDNVNKVHYPGESGLGAHNGSVVEVASHGELGVALEQWERRMDVGPKLLFDLHLEDLKGCDKIMKMEGHPMMSAEENLKEGAVTLVGAL
jgi:hypothetical protein